MKRIGLFIAVLWPVVTLAQFGPFQRPFVIVDSNLTAKAITAVDSGNSTKFPRGDGTWQTISGGGGSSSITTQDVLNLITAHPPSIAAVLGAGANASGLSIAGLTQLQAQQLLDDSGPVALRLDTRTAYQSDGTSPAFSWSNGLQIAGSPVLTAPATNGLLTVSTAAATYQPIGSYAPSTVTNVSLGPYLLSADALAIYQPIGPYAAPSITNGLLPSAAAASLYAPIIVTNVNLGPYLPIATQSATNAALQSSISANTATGAANAGSITALQSFDMAQALTNAAVQTQLGSKLATNGTISASQISGGTLPMGVLTTTGTNIAGAFLATDGAGSRYYTRDGSTLTNIVKLSLGIPPGSALVYGSTNDALLAGISGANSSWDELQFNDTTQQRARWVIPSSITARYAGGALTNQIWWRGTSTVGAVVWQVGIIGRTNSTLVDVAYQNITVGSNTVSGVGSNFNVTTIVLTPTNCPAGSLWLYELQRLPANAADTMVGDARVISIGVNE